MDNKNKVENKASEKDNKIFWLDWTYKAKWWLYIRNIEIHKFVKLCEKDWFEIVWIRLENDWKLIEFIYKDKEV